MYGPRRTNYNPRMSSMQLSTPMETPMDSPLGSLNTPAEGQEDAPGYFDFAGQPAESQPWQQQEQPPNGPLDPMEEMERELMGYDSQFSVVPQMPMLEPGMDQLSGPQMGEMDPRMSPQVGSHMPDMNPQISSHSQVGTHMDAHLNPQLGGAQIGPVNPHTNGLVSQMRKINPRMNTQVHPRMDRLNRMGHVNHMNAIGRVNAQPSPQLQARQLQASQLQAGQLQASQLQGTQGPQIQSPQIQGPRLQGPPVQDQLRRTSSASNVHSGMSLGLQNPRLSMPALSPGQHHSLMSGTSTPGAHPGTPGLVPTGTGTKSASQPLEPTHPSVPMVVDGPQPVHDLRLEELQKSRKRYKPRSSIPPDLSSANYAAQCIAAAESSRLNPYYLSSGEYNHLRKTLPRIHVTTYLNIRNGILRLWLANPLVAVTLVEAAGCCKEARYYQLAEFAFEWLVRNGYINQGCCTHLGRHSSSIAGLPKFSNHRRKPRQTIVVVGAGVAGLSCARQLENLLDRYSTSILADYEELPRVIVLEGRKRIGGRVYSPKLSTDHSNVDLGGGTIMGFGGGNPLGVVLRRQLGVPVVSIDTTSDDNVLYDGTTGDPISAQTDYRTHEIFNYLLDRMRTFEMGLGAMNQPPVNAPGVKSLIRAGQDPRITKTDDENITVAQFEEDLERPYTRADEDSSDEAESREEVKVELDFLKSLGLTTKPRSDESQEIRVHAEPAVQGASLGLTMNKLMEHLSSLTELSEQDNRALQWYLAKFEYAIGDNIDNACLSSWSHHRSNRFTGRHAWSRDGMSALVKGLDTVPGKLDVRFKTVVNVIEYEEDSSQVTLENGEQFTADRIVVTVPLGCLKRRSMQFIPDLPQWKLDSIDRLEFGTVNKVVLVFDESFWDPSTPALIRVTAGDDKDSRGNCFVFQNHARRRELGGKAVIVGLVSGDAAKDMSEKPDFEVVQPAVETLRRVFKKHPKAQSATLVESIVTRWQVDRFSRGTFSHVGVDGTVTDHDLLARPVMRSLFFAGEATSRMYPGTIHGAYISGLRAAKEVLNSLVGGIEVPDELLINEQDWFYDDVSMASSHDHHDVSAHDPGEARAASISETQGNEGMTPTSLRQHHHHQRSASPTVPAMPSAGATERNVKLNGRLSSNGAVYGSLNSHGGSSEPELRNSGGSAGNSGFNENSGEMKDMLSVAGKRHIPSPDTVPSFEPVDYSKAEAELSDLRRRRELLEHEQMERDLMHEVGQRPEKPERHGTTNPFLLFQKDYWDICRQETEASKSKDKKTGQVHASRNEIRSSLGKRWRSLPDAERAPYIERSQQAKIENEERQETFLRKLKWFESEAANFRQQWVEEHPSTPSLRERQLEEQLENYRPRKKRSRLTE